MKLHKIHNLLHGFRRFAKHGRQQRIAVYLSFTAAKNHLDTGLFSLPIETLSVIVQFIIFSCINEKWWQSCQVAEKRGDACKEYFLRRLKYLKTAFCQGAFLKGKQRAKHPADQRTHCPGGAHADPSNGLIAYPQVSGRN